MKCTGTVPVCIRIRQNKPNLNLGIINFLRRVSNTEKSKNSTGTYCDGSASFMRVRIQEVPHSANPDPKHWQYWYKLSRQFTNFNN